MTEAFYDLFFYDCRYCVYFVFALVSVSKLAALGLCLIAYFVFVCS